MRTGIATSAKLFRSWFYHWQQNFCTFHFHYFVTPRPARKIILGNLLHGRMPRTVSSHHRLFGMIMLAGKPDCGFQLERIVKLILLRMDWQSSVSATWIRGIEMQPWLFFKQRVLLCLRNRAQPAQQTTAKVKMVRTWKILKFLAKGVTQILLRR